MNTQTITIIIGLPGSGKTTYIQNNRNTCNDIIICDDYHKSGYNHSHMFEDSRYYNDLKFALQNGKDIVISDIARCKSERRKDLEENIKNILREEQIDAKLVFIYFANDPISCKKNILKRNRDGRVEKELAFIDEVSGCYEIPHGAKSIPISI